MRRIFTLSFVLFLFIGSNAQTSETHVFTTYDTTYTSNFGSWQIRITRPVNLFTPGSPDTASRPAIITMPGIGETGNNNPNNLIAYGPHYWLLNGWDGSVVLGNGTHYPIIITVSYISNTWPAGEQTADVLAFLLSHYHIKRNSVHLGGLSLGSFMWTSLIAFEAVPGAETGMSMVTSITALEGFSLYQDAPYSTWSRGDVAYQVWAQKYHGKYFGLEGTDDYRNVAQGEKDMNSVVRGSAHFSYENLGGGAHCCWNSMYDPSQHNWQSFPPYGPNVATGADTNSRGNYQNGSSIFQWMLRQGDTSIVGSGKAAPPTPVANAGTSQSITLPTSSVTLAGSGSEQGGTIKSYAWTLSSGPTQYAFSNAGIANPVVSNLAAGTYVFRLTVTDANGATATGTVSIVVNAAPKPPTPVANAGSSQSITLPTSSVTLAGSGSEQGGTIKSYAWTLSSGPTQYAFSNAGIANPVVSNLAAGTYVFRLTVTDANGATATGTVSIVVNAAPKPPTPVANAGTSQSITLPTSSVTLAGSGSEQGGTIKGYAWTRLSGPTQYTFSNAGIANPVVSNLAAGTYIFQLAVTDANGAKATDTMAVVVNAAPKPPTPVANAGTSQSITLPTSSVTLAGSGSEQGGTIKSYAWTLYSGPTQYTFSNAGIANPVVSNLAAGTYVFRLTVTDANGAKATDTASIVVNAAKPPAGVSITYPLLGVIQAESYSSMSGVATQATSDAGGGLNVGWINQGDWMAYTVNVAVAGVYTVNFRVATPDDGASFTVDNGAGAVYAQVTVPNTGGFQTWGTASAKVTLNAGVQTIRVVSTSFYGWNFNWMSFTTSSSSVFTVPGVIQAENYASMSGVATQATLDAGGGLNVGWINQGDWMEYIVNVATAGTYTVKFRVATADDAASFLLDDGLGNTYAQIAVPNTGGFQTYGTATARVNLKAGVQTIRLVSTAFFAWNINWIEFDAGAVGTSDDLGAVSGAAVSSFAADTSLGRTPVLLLYPNPTPDAFYLEMNDSHTGKFQVQVINPAGRMVKAYSFEKGLSQMQVQVSMAGLPAGVYVIHIGGDSWQEVRKVIKL